MPSHPQLPTPVAWHFQYQFGLFGFSRVITQGIADTEVKVSSAERNPGLSRVLTFKPGVGQNIAFDMLRLLQRICLLIDLSPPDR